MTQKRQKPSKDDEVWRKYGVGEPASDTLDMFDEPGRIGLNSKPESIALLERYGAKPPMDEWFASINEPSAPSLDVWKEGLTRPPMDSEFVAVTAEELSSSEEYDLLSSDEMEVRQPLNVNWGRYSAAELDNVNAAAFAKTACVDTIEIDVAMSVIGDKPKKIRTFDSVLGRLGIDFYELEDSTSVPGRRLRYYLAAHRNLFVVLLLEEIEQRSKLKQYFYLDAI